VAADKPNFSGDWKIDNDKSNFGPMPPPNSLTRKITHADPAVTMDEAASGPQGDQKRTVKYDTTGKETTNEMMGQATKSTAVWDGAKLVITTNTVKRHLKAIFEKLNVHTRSAATAKVAIG